MNVNIKIERSMDVEVPLAQARMLLDDWPQTLKRFPKLRTLAATDDGAYLWEMDAIGSTTARIQHEVRYTARFEVDSAAGTLRWRTLPKLGNAQLEGMLSVTAHGSATRLGFSVRGELREVPVPLMYRLLAPPFIQGKFTRLVDVFLERTRDQLIAR